MFSVAWMAGFRALFISRQNGVPCRDKVRIDRSPEPFVSRLQDGRPGFHLVRSLLIDGV